jgi:hypothetical protein
MDSRLALQSVSIRPREDIPLTQYHYPLGLDLDRKKLILDEWVEVVKRDNSLPVNDLYLGLIRFDPSTLTKEDDVGLIHTTIEATDVWRVNSLLSHMPSYLRTLDKRMGVSSHFPQTGLLDLSPTTPTTRTQLAEIERRVSMAAQEGTYLLLDSNLPRSSREGYCMPKGWLWDIYDEVARRLDPNYNSEDADRYNEDTCIYCSNGKITYGKNGRGIYIDLNGNEYDDTQVQEVATKITDEYALRTNILLQQLYEEGIVHLISPVGTAMEMVRVNERLWKPLHPVYPSAVQLLYHN